MDTDDIELLLLLILLATTSHVAICK